MKKSTFRYFFTFLFGLAFYTTSAQLVINEIDYDQPSADSSEFIELYNFSGNTILLSDYTILLFNGNTASLMLYDSLTLPNIILNPGEFFVICGSSTGLVANCDTFLSASVGPGAIQNGGSSASPSADAVALRFNPTQTIVDAVSYEGNCPAPYIEGNGTVDSLSDNGVTAAISISRYPDGHDTQDNSADFVLVCSTPGSANCAPTGISENGKFKKAALVYPNPASSVVTVESASARNISVSLRNILGKEIKQISSVKNKVLFDISGLDVGVYLLFIRTELGESTERLIIRR